MLVVLCCFSFLTQSQTVKKDSISEALKQQIKQAKSDSLRINGKLDLAGRMARFNLDTAVVIIKDVQKEIEKLDQNSAFYKKTKFTVLKSFAAVESIRGNFSNALEQQLKAVNYSIEIKDSISLGIVYGELAYTYRGLKDLTNAEKYYRLAFKIQEKHSTPRNFALTHHSLGFIYIKTKKLDSALFMFERAKKINPTKNNILTAESNIATVYKAQKKYDKALETNKRFIKLSDPNNYPRMGIAYANLASTYGFLEDWEKALKAVDSSIYYNKFLEKKLQLVRAYKFKAEALHHLEKYKEAYTYQALYKVYFDSVNNVAEQKRITELELNHKFDKEREIAAVELTNEKSKKTLYVVLFLVAIIAGVITLLLVRKNNKQRLQLAQKELELKEVEKLKSDLALANRENELKKVVIENSITEEVLNKTLDDIKEIITFQNEKERQVALRSLSADLLSEKSSQKSVSNIKTYVDQVHMDFKIYLDTNYPILTPKDKELIYLMKAGLSSSQISKVLNTTLPAIRSNRYRLRKKLNLSSSEDIIEFLDQKKTS
ncbi:hypothetical protein [Aquimarina litoralis]|uniref:hypothetical protein n=1 Tax=Aquimarina litoralis TaxID=584605 RepID=UPI001C586016|nr:hypothetical protein [Aquimarina litoralis]